MDHWLDWTLRALMSILGAIGVRLWYKQEKLEDRQNAMQVNCVTRADLRSELTQMREERTAMHLENKSDLKDLKTSIDGVNASLHMLAREVAGRGPGRRSRP